MTRDLPVVAVPPEHLAALSHELRTPLNGVIGMARLLEGTRLTAEQRSYVAALTESGEHLLGLVNDVLDYTRLGAGRVELSAVPVYPEDLLRSVCELLSPKAHEKGVEIGWAAEAGLAPFLADEGRLRQILHNLAGNAVKFVEAGGVLVTAERVGSGRLRFTVSDTGPGVPAALKERIFEAFVQAHPATGGGAGLGLAIAGGLARAMGGELGLDNREGQGADFWVEAGFPPAGEAPECTDLAGLAVGVVSPSAVVREAAVRQILASGGCALAAESLGEVSRKIGAGAVLLMDHALSRSGGPPRPPAGHAAIILIRPEERDLIPAYRQAGFDGYLIKPLRRASLVERVVAAGDTQGDDDRISPQGARPAGPAAGGARVLLAEDNPINAMLAKTLLRREGAVVRHAAGGQATLQALSAESFDLILMDLRMPDVSGLDVTRILRMRGIKTPVVALTANAFDDDRRAALAAGMNDFLVKPLAPEALREMLARWTGPGWTKPDRRAKVGA
jgi:CheY-like chemotaxis protein